MSNHDHPSTLPEPNPEDLPGLWQRVVGRRSFLSGIAGATVAAVPAAGFLSAGALAAESRPTHGDVAILRFLAAAEIIESDLWSQYNELGGANGGNPAYKAALQNLDSDMPQYISDTPTTNSATRDSSTPTCDPRAPSRSHWIASVTC